MSSSYLQNIYGMAGVNQVEAAIPKTPDFVVDQRTATKNPILI